MGVQDKESLDHKTLVAVTNFEMSTAADQMKSALREGFKGECDVILVDSSSSVTPATADEVIPNEYYTGLWNKSVGIAIEKEYEWLFFIASDVQTYECKKMCGLIREACGNPKIGVYCPSLDNKSRFSFKDCAFGGTGGVRDCKSIEGFCFLSKVEILREIYPITENKYGYCVDGLTCEIARRMGYRVVVDDRTTIFHPKSEIPIDKREATRKGTAFYWAKINEFEQNQQAKKTSRAKNLP